MTRRSGTGNEVPLERRTGDLGRRVFDAALLLALSRALTRAIGLINLVILARLLSPEDYGVVALAFTFISLLSAMLETGGGSYLVVREDLTRAHLDTAFTMQLLRGLALAIIIFAGAGPVARLAGSEALGPVLHVLALSPMLAALGNPALELYGRNLDFRREIVRNLGATALATTVAIAFALWLGNYWALVAGTLASHGLGAWLTHWRVPYRPRLSLKDWQAFASFGGWVGAERVFSMLITAAPQIVVWSLLSPAMLGKFTVARNIQDVPLEEATQPLRRSILPSLAGLAGDMPALRRVFRKIQAVICGCALPIGVGLALAAEDVILVLVGRQWLEAAIVLQILSPVLALKLAVGPVSNVAMVLGRLPQTLARTIVIAIVAYPVLFWATLRYGLVGAAGGLAFLTGFRISLNAFLARRMLGESLFGLVIVGRRSFVASLFMAGGLILFPAADPAHSFLPTLMLLTLKAVGGLAIYVIAHNLLWLAEGRPDGFERIVVDHASSSFERGREWLARRRWPLSRNG